MKLSQKDKSLILFFVALIIIVWALLSFFSNLYYNAAYHISDVNNITKNKEVNWLNASRSISQDELKDRVILLDFWSLSCSSCLKNLPRLKKFQEKFGSKLTIISVHSGNFANERNRSIVRNAILKYNISHLVIDDSNLEIYKSFNVKQLPTYFLINPKGNIEKKYDGSKLPNLSKVEKDISKLISKYRYELNRENLPVFPEKNNVLSAVLSSPSKITFVKKFQYGNEKIPAIITSNSGDNNIIISNLSGKIIKKIGKKTSGFIDGDFSIASFKNPAGVIYKNNKIYVADSGNHAVRVVDLEKNEVSTLIGNGESGGVLIGRINSKKIRLSYPTDIAFFPDENNLVIANSGSNQIFSYDIDKSLVLSLAGNGNIGMKDGKYPDNELAQTQDFYIYKDKLYFLDAKSSSLRYLEKNGSVKTLIGQGISKFGYENGSKSTALMQNPKGLMVDETGIYIADSLNHLIRKYDFKTKQIKTLSGSKEFGNLIGNSTKYFEPSDLVSILDRLYIVDSSNNRIVILNRSNISSKIYNLMPKQKLYKETLLQYMPNLKKSKDVKISAINNKITINVKDGWKINEEGPSFINLINLVGKNRAKLVANFDWKEVLKREILLPNLKNSNDYVVQGVIYYCEDKKNALCYIENYEQTLQVSDEFSNEEGININIPNLKKEI